MPLLNIYGRMTLKGVPKPANLAWNAWRRMEDFEPNSGDTNCHLDWVTAKVTVVPVPDVSAGKETEALEKRGNCQVANELAGSTCTFDKLNGDMSGRSAKPEQQIRQIYETLSREWGPQHWWPAQSRFEVIVGAFLTQNTSWSNVELAMRKLRAARVLSVAGIRGIKLEDLEKLVRSSGYFRQKAQRLKSFVSFLDRNYGGSLTLLFSQPTAKLREELLALNGIGPETADSILLYGGQHPVFVVDAYTRRLAARHNIAPETAKYQDLQTTFESALRVVPPRAERGTFLPEGASHPPSPMSVAQRCSTAQVFNDMHGFMVGIGKNYCRKTRPDCEHCPLASLLPKARVS